MTNVYPRPVMFAQRYVVVLLGCFALYAAQPQVAYALRPRPPLRFEIKTVEPSTGKRKTTYAVGEPVAVVFTLTNRGRRVRKIKELQDTGIPLTLTWRYNRSDRIDSREGMRGGTGGSYTTPDGTTFWTSRDPRHTVISPGQTIKVEIDDLRRFFAIGLDDGEYTLTATYEGGLRARCSFKVVIDEARSVPILERMVRNGADGSGRWADIYLGLIRQPSISGRIAVARGRGLKGVTIYIGGSEKTNIETRSDGLFDLTHLIRGGTYTLTPSLEGYTFIPSSRTIRNLTSKLRGVNFTARRIPASVSRATEGGQRAGGRPPAFDKPEAPGAERVTSNLHSRRACRGVRARVGSRL